MTVIEKNSEHYVGYEYMEIKADSRKASMYTDAYENFGWERDENLNISFRQNVYSKTGMPQEGENILLRFKRDRKILNKTELTRLQRNFEDCMNQIDELEKSKTGTAMIVSISTGVIGTMFMAGSTFAVTAPTPVIWLCVLLAIPGFAGWILPYFLYKKIVSKRIEIVKPLIEDKYDEIYEICEKGSGLLGKNGGADDDGRIEAVNGIIK